MSWRKAVLGLAAVLALAGCGFQPLYDSDHPTSAALASVRVQQITQRYGQEMTNELRDGFNPTARAVAPTYELSVGLTETTSDVAIRQDSTASRTDTSLIADWSLRRLSDGKVVVQGRARSQTGHDVLDTEYANVVSGNSDLERAVRDVSGQIQNRVAIYLQNPA
jgi:LPS-assembly lipoprotein